MTAPTPEPSGYNTMTRPRGRKKMRMLSPPSELEGYYSAFWPLLIVFLAFIILLVYEVSFLRHRAFNLTTQNTRLADGVQKANTQMAFIQGLHGDLANLAPTHPAAAAILKAFFPAAPQESAAPATSGDTPPATAPGGGSGLPPATAPPHP